ncbi:unnamed protein product [Linum trigynum]
MKAAAAAAIIAAAALFATVSGQPRGSSFCSCGRAGDQQNFPLHVRAVLDIVANRTSSQVKNPDSGDTVFTTTSNPGANLDAGAAVATGTCFKGAPTECSACLRELRELLKPCEEFGCGGVEFTGDCHLQFGQIK